MIEDLIPENMTLDTFNMVYGGSAATPVPGASVNQSGDMLEIEFDTQ